MVTALSVISQEERVEGDICPSMEPRTPGFGDQIKDQVSGSKTEKDQATEKYEEM